MKEKVKAVLKRTLAVMTAVAMAFSIISFMPDSAVTAEAAQQQKVIKITPTNCKNVEKILPEATKHYEIDNSSKNYKYVFKITLAEASKLRITGLARYTFWNGGGTVNYKLTDALTYSNATFVETWSTGVYSDHTWEEKVGNYCDKLFTLNKGTYYLFVNTDLTANWREETYLGKTIYDYPSGLWLSVNKAAYTKTPTLKSARNSASSTVKLTYTKVSNAKGYQIQYSTNKKFTSPKYVTAKKNSATIKKMKKGKTYFFRVRAYRIISGKKYWGAWSNVKSVKVRK